MARLYHTQYHNARYCAKQRNIDWQFTYDEWVSWWGTDITNRGPHKGQLVMARNNDTGPYNINNVHKKTASENCREAHLGKPKSIEQVLKMSEVRKGKDNFQTGLKRSIESKLKMSKSQLKRYERERIE